MKPLSLHKHGVSQGLALLGSVQEGASLCALSHLLWGEIAREGTVCLI